MTTIRSGAAALLTALSLLCSTLAPAAAAPATVWPAAAVPGIVTSEAPSAEDFGGRLYVASLSTDLPEDSRIQLSSTPLTGSSPSWTTRLLLPPSDPNSTITAKVFASRLWLAFRAQNQKVYVGSSTDGVSFGGWRSLAGSDDGRGAVSLKGFGSRLYLAARDTAGNLEVASRTSGGDWGAFTTVPGLTSPYRPVLTEFSDRLTIGATGADGLVRVSSSTGGTSWSAWKAAPAFGTGVATAGPALTVWHDRLRAGARVGTQGPAGPASLRLASFDGRAWSAWSTLANPPLRNEPCLTTAAGDLIVATEGDPSQAVVVQRLR
jgi:hypothetical protein